jgi:hypothetical protein
MSACSVAHSKKRSNRKASNRFISNNGKRLITPSTGEGSGNATVRIYDDQGGLECEIAPPAEEHMLYAPHVRSAC